MVRVWYLSCDAASSASRAERVLFVHMYMYRCAPGWARRERARERERMHHPFRVEEGVGLFLGCVCDVLCGLYGTGGTGTGTGRPVLDPGTGTGTGTVTAYSYRLWYAYRPYKNRALRVVRFTMSASVCFEKPHLSCGCNFRRGVDE